MPAFEQAAFECAGFFLRALCHVVVCLENEAHARFHGIGAIFGLGDVRGLAEERERAFARGGEQRAGAACDLAFRQIGPQMEAENAVDVVFLEHPRFADELRATGGFLGGLEYDEHAALKFVEMRGDMAREAERHGHVPVVAACVHLPVMRGTERHSRFFGHGQRVHIGANGGCVLASAIEPRAYRGSARLEHFTWQLVDNRMHVRDGFRQIEVNFGNLVQVAAVLREVGQRGFGKHAAARFAFVHSASSSKSSLNSRAL